MMDTRTNNIAAYPPEILKEISKFLNMRDVLNLQSSSKSMKESINLEVNNNAMPGLPTTGRWYGEDNETHLWLRIDPIFIEKVHSIQITCKFKDQGWGNRKSYLYIAELNEARGDNEKSMGRIICSSHLAEHHDTDLRFEYCPEPGKIYSIWHRVGGGGGHQLHVRNLKIKSLLNDPICAKLMKSNLCMKDKFFRMMFMAVVQTMSQSSDDDESNAHFSSLFESIGLTLNGDMCQIESMKQFIEEWDRYKRPTIFLSRWS